MPTPTYDLIASNVLSSSASSVTFSSIPATYRDLVVSVFIPVGANAIFPRLRLNSDSGSNYSEVYAYGDGSSTGSASATSLTSVRIWGSYVAVNARANAMIQIMDYSATDKHKTVLARYNDQNTATYMYAHRWASTSAINSLNFSLDTAENYPAGSVFNLFGIVS